MRQCRRGLWLVAVLMVWAAPVPAQSADEPAAMRVASVDEPSATQPRGGDAPTRVHVVVLNASGERGAATKVAVLLREYRRRALESRMGLRLEVVNVSNADTTGLAQSVIHFRSGYLRAAILIAEAMPGEQRIRPMREPGRRVGVDVQILVGKELP